MDRISPKVHQAQSLSASDFERHPAGDQKSSAARSRVLQPDTPADPVGEVRKALLARSTAVVLRESNGTRRAQIELRRTALNADWDIAEHRDDGGLAHCLGYTIGGGLVSVVSTSLSGLLGAPIAFLSLTLAPSCAGLITGCFVMRRSESVFSDLRARSGHLKREEEALAADERRAKTERDQAEASLVALAPYLRQFLVNEVMDSTRMAADPAGIVADYLASD